MAQEQSGSTGGADDDDNRDAHLVVRPIEAGDYAKGYMELLAQLTAVDDVDERLFQDTLAQMQSCAGMYHIMVVEDTARGRVVGSATALIERKIIHGCGRVCHVEDVVVDEAYRGKRIGKRLLLKLHEIARQSGCYKSILDCHETKVAFYEKVDYVRRSVHMAKYY